MKRKIIEEGAIREKKQKMTEWISATKTKNYLLNDTCVDWLEMYYDWKGNKQNNKLEILFEGGYKSENKLYDELKRIFKGDFQIVQTDEDFQKFREENRMDGWIRHKYNQTIDLMKNGVPLIGQGVMINDDDQTYGIADLLIRSDYLATLFDYFELDDEIKRGAPLLGHNKYHYRVIDYKWTLMFLCVDGITVRNTGRFPAYKGQLAIYTNCLKQMQGYMPNYAYLMCKGWRIERTKPTAKDTGYSCFDRPGIINYNGKDKHFIELTRSAVNWIRRLKEHGRGWSYGSVAPSVIEMYPNMNKSYNPNMNKVKQELAERYNDITQVWYLDHTHRAKAHKRGILSCQDPRLNCDILGIKGKRRETIDKILWINRKETPDLFYPKIIKNNDNKWQKEYDMDYYIDMETINQNIYMDANMLEVYDNYMESEVTFMIGIGFRRDLKIGSLSILDNLELGGRTIGYHHVIDNEWEYVCFYMKSFKQLNESELYLAFYEFIFMRKLMMSSNNKIRFFHWTGAELRFMEKAKDRIRLMNWNESSGYQQDLLKMVDRDILWIDCCHIFQNEPIVIKGAYRYKLKLIARAMYKQKMIDILWEESEVMDGFSAMLSAIELYRGSIYNGKGEIIESYKQIIRYNEIDCRVMWEIIRYLRGVHCKCKNKIK